MKKVIITLTLLLAVCAVGVGLASCGEVATTTEVPTTTTEVVIAQEGPTSEGLAYNLNEDGSGYMVTGIGLCTDVYVVIPKTHRGYPVTAINDQAFYECHNLKRVTIPNSITSIGKAAFYWCDSLESVTMGSGVTSIGEDAFSNCSRLTYITLSNRLISIGKYAFSSCVSLTSITIPDSVTSVGYKAFSSCDNLIINCEVESEPVGWNSYWNYYNIPVVWGYKG